MPFKFKKPLKTPVDKDPIEYSIDSKEILNASTSLDKTTLTKVENITDIDSEERIINGSPNSTLNVTRISKSILMFPFATNSITLHDITDSTLVFLPTKMSILLHNCRNTRLVASAQQIRLHDSQDLELYLSESTAVIIENCNRIGLAPYEIVEDLSEFSTTNFPGLKSSNMHSLATVQDFECIVGKSPNWYQMEKKEWRSFSVKNLEKNKI